MFVDPETICAAMLQSPKGENQRKIWKGIYWSEKNNLVAGLHLRENAQ